MNLIPAIVRDANTGSILMLAWMNDESLQKTKETGETWFWSRSRNELWHKGATSGNTQRVVHIAEDCDHDALVISVIPNGPACHTGSMSCFEGIPPRMLDRLLDVLRDRREKRPPGSYSASLFDKGRDKIVKKIGEEAVEVIIAAKGEGRQRTISEIADLVFHVSVLMADEGLDWRDIEAELGVRSLILDFPRTVEYLSTSGRKSRIKDLTPSMLIDEAKAARENAVAPFSKFKVGAALRTASGKVYRGCNVENCTYGLTVCAERVALLSALAAGERDFNAIAVVTQSEEPSTPCGPCRQLMWEYCGDIDVTLANLVGHTIEYKLSALFPHPFSFCIE